MRRYQSFIVKEIHFMGRHHRHLVQHVITGRRDSQFSVEHVLASLSEFTGPLVFCPRRLLKSDLV
jgi:hypothetical protein